MNKKIVLIIPLLLSSTLISCDENANSSGGPQTAQSRLLASVKHVNHRAHVEQTNRTTYPRNTSTGAVGLGIDHSLDFAYSYDNGERAYSTSGYSTHFNIDNQTGEIIESSITEYNVQTSRVFEEEGTGLALIESMNPDNTVTTAYASDYDETTAIYTPLSFANNFSNPWDYIEESDLTLGDDGNFHLSSDKAEFLLESYALSGTNMVTDAIITTDEQDALKEIEFVMPDYETSSYVRKTSVTITYSDFGELTKIEHLTPFENDNPELAEAFKCLDNATSFTYRKQFGDSFSAFEPSDTTGYFTQDAIFFHQRADKHPNEFYTDGDDYDYLSKKNPRDGKYYGFMYDLIELGFVPAMLSDTQQLVKDSFIDNGPSFGQLSAALFRKTGDLTYEVEPSITSWIGQYFDNGFDGVHSDILSTSTLSCVVYLTSDKKAIDKVEVGADIGTGKTTITYTLSDINSTEIPEFALEAISEASFD